MSRSRNHRAKEVAGPPGRDAGGNYFVMKPKTKIAALLLIVASVAFAAGAVSRPYTWQEQAAMNLTNANQFQATAPMLYYYFLGRSHAFQEVSDVLEN